MLLTLSSTIAVFAALGVVAGRRAHRTAPDVTLENAHRECRWLVAACVVGLLLLAVPLAAQISDRVCQELPLRFQRDAGTVTWILLVALFPLIAGAVSTIAVLTRHPKRRRLLFAIGSIVSLLAIAGWLQCRPIHPQLFIDRSPDGVVLQSSGSSCAAATIANIAESYGMRVSEAEAAELMGTTALGSSPGQMRWALTELGIGFETLNERTPRLLNVRSPAILFVDHPSIGREGHAVGYFGRARDGRFVIVDPLEGVLYPSAVAFERIWHGNGIECLGPSRRG